jgi:alkanesulfonate monooxygenase SsuD/methylene tetrahydromethanopterin reductase-like flavin-dependent oxidoreductase (luciferase family)
VKQRSGDVKDEIELIGTPDEVAATMREMMEEVSGDESLIGPPLRASGFSAQQTEAAINVVVLNWMLAAGRSDSVRR